jgi:hypothetical protein
MTLRSMTQKQWEQHVAGMIYIKSKPPVRSSDLVRRRGAVDRQRSDGQANAYEAPKRAGTPDAGCGNTRHEGQRRHNAGIASCPLPNK